MSNNWLNVLPADPTLLPSKQQARRLLAQIGNIAPDAELIEVRNSGQVEFVDAGGNFESIHCPICRSAIDMEWFGARMDAASSTRFESLQVVTPCCGKASDLNELVYDWPQGFARWHVSIRSPGRGELAADEVASLSSAFGAPVRVVWTHY